MSQTTAPNCAGLGLRPYLVINRSPLGRSNARGRRVSLVGCILRYTSSLSIHSTRNATGSSSLILGSILALDSFLQELTGVIQERGERAGSHYECGSRVNPTDTALRTCLLSVFPCRRSPQTRHAMAGQWLRLVSCRDTREACMLKTACYQIMQRRRFRRASYCDK